MSELVAKNVLGGLTLGEVYKAVVSRCSSIVMYVDSEYYQTYVATPTRNEVWQDYRADPDPGGTLRFKHEWIFPLSINVVVKKNVVEIKPNQLERISRLTPVRVSRLELEFQESKNIELDHMFMFMPTK